MIEITIKKGEQTWTIMVRPGTTLKYVLEAKSIVFRNDKEVCVNAKEEEVYLGTTLRSTQTITIKKRP